MTPLSDTTLAHLRQVADRPDLTGTPYELLEPLGRGGMGAVYLVTDLELQRSVALKVLCDPDPDAEAVERLLAEARVIAGLEHPGIVPVYDVGRLPDGRAFYTMKRVRGTRLDARLREGPPLTERLRIFERICEPVAFAHAHGVIHCDLKPANVMVGSFGEVLVMDWGLAWRREPSLATSRSDEDSDADRGSVCASAVGEASQNDARRRVIGTPGYMSPEQERGEDGRVDERSDVYSLGALLYFLLTGRNPGTHTQDSTRSGTPGSARVEAPLPPRRIDAGIPRALESICLKAMAAAPSARYASVSELAADVGRFLAEVRVHAHRETAFERAERFARRYRTPIALILAYLAMRVVMLFVARS